ncbi:hypothetical protein GJ496_009427 [Pomphorhynchus laevis]|nr:hypothetical protein GJ496_009427 [Pomphorhynchus laevis]
MDDTFDIMVLSHLSLCTMLEHKEPLAAVHLHDIHKAIITYCEKLELYEKKKDNDDMRPSEAGISQLNNSKCENLSRIILREIFFLIVVFLVIIYRWI